MTDITLHRELLNVLPTPLVQSFEKLRGEPPSAGLRRVYRLIDLIESLCKLYTVASLSSFLDTLEQHLIENNQNRTYIEEARITLATGLRTPSLGIWWKFARVCTQTLNTLNVPHILPGAIEAVDSSLKKAFDDEDNLISFRNSYAHGATKSEEDCQKDLDVRWKTVAALLADARPLLDAELLVVHSSGTISLARGATLIPTEATGSMKNGHLYFRYCGSLVDLHPLLTYHEEEGLFYFYNDLKENSAVFLNYPLARRYADNELYQQILERIPIKKWQKQDSTFANRIELLTETFKGRREEMALLTQFVQERHTGFLVVWGQPGVGKSALLARFAQLMGFAPEIRKEYDQGPLPEGIVHRIEYFIRRGENNTDKASNMLEYLAQRLTQIFHLKEGKGGKTDVDRKNHFDRLLNKVGEILRDKNEKLLFIIDGLDEADADTPLVKSLPRYLPPKVLAIYGARPIYELKTGFYEESLDRENRDALELTGFKNQDEIRAILDDYVSKYDLKMEYVNAILEKSEGNPLYIKLLCKKLMQSEYQLNDIAALPKSWEEMYSHAMSKLGEKSPKTLDFLVLLAAAQDYVGPQMAARVLDLPDTVLQSQILPHCMEYLHENPLTVLVEDYQLFHETLRGFLQEKYKATFREQHRRLADYCAKWKKENGDLAYDDEQTLRYAMQFAIPHLYEEWKTLNLLNKPTERNQRKEQILALTDDPMWREYNFNALGNGEALRIAYTRSQELLLDGVQAPEPALSRRLLYYALQIHEEPLRLYAQQVEKLKFPHDLSPSHEEILKRILQIATMGETPLQKMLLVFLARWSMREKPILHKDFIKTATMWVDESNDMAIRKLWALSFTY